MRLVDGPSLEELITNQGYFSWLETLEIITAIAEGLDHAHAQGGKYDEQCGQKRDAGQGRQFEFQMFLRLA